MYEAHARQAEALANFNVQMSCAVGGEIVNVTYLPRLQAEPHGHFPDVVLPPVSPRTCQALSPSGQGLQIIIVFAAPTPGRRVQSLYGISSRSAPLLPTVFHGNHSTQAHSFQLIFSTI